MSALSGITESPYFKEGVFLFAVLLLLGAWKFGLEGVLE
jgi:hypothetical protein